MGKKINQRFVEGLCQELIKVGAVEIKAATDSFRTFNLNTVVGNLEINVDKNTQYCFTMFSRFDNVEAAKVKFPCNPHSGKYNVLIGRNGITPKRAIEFCMNVIKGTLPKKNKFEEIAVGETYLSVSHSFNNAENKITCISDDFTGLNRGIKYFCFTDRISKVPTKQEFIDSLKDDALTLPSANVKKAQYDKAQRVLEIRKHTFAMWDYEVNGIDGFAPSTSILSL